MSCEIVECPRKCSPSQNARCASCDGRGKFCKTHGSVLCSDDTHCVLSHMRDEPEDLGIQGAWILPGVRVVNSGAIQKRIDSEGRWGFLAGLVTGLLVAGLVYFFGPP